MTASPPPPAPPPALPMQDLGPGVESAGLIAAENAPRLTMAQMLEPSRLRAAAQDSWDWVRAELLNPDTALQIGLVALAVLAAIGLSRAAGRLADPVFRPIEARRYGPRARQVFDSMARPALMLLLFLLLQAAFDAIGQPAYALRIAINLTVAWIIIRLATHAITEPFWARTAAVIVFAITALNIFGLLAPITALLDSIGFTLGSARISVFSLARGVIIAVLLFWLAAMISGVARTRIDRLPGLTPSARILLSKTLQLVLVVIAVLLALTSFGVNFTAFAVFSGALGLAIGFGLQRIFSNLVAGVMLLLDRSIKPGDVIEVSNVQGQPNTYGYVRTLGLRYSSVVTRDNHEYLIPNEEFILNKVVNWSFSDRAVRLRRPVRVAYGTDLRLAQSLMLEAAASVERVLAHPKPVCLLTEFAESAVMMEIRFWISDPQNGVNNVSSDVLFAIWERFGEHGLRFPFPQRELTLKGGEAIAVRLEGEGPDGAPPGAGA